MLYFVATPIGNLKDFSYRAEETLRLSDKIFCEDTRRTLKLLNAYGIKKPLYAYHKYNEKKTAPEIVELLKKGETLSVVSDAGMPVVSDPGGVLVSALIENGLDFTVIPGACAAVSALVLSGFPAEKFCFLGFLPEKTSEKKALLEKYNALDMTLIFYSAPHNVLKDVSAIYAAFGDRTAAAVKEITKIHEKAEYFRLKDGYPFEPKGEYVLIVEGAKNENPLLNLSPREHVEFFMAQGMVKTDAMKKAAKERGVPKSELYKIML